MSKNSLTYTVLWLLIQLLIGQTASFKPLQRYLHTATLIDDKLYILGGYNEEIAGKQFFYLDVSVSFNTQELLWNDLTSTNIVPSHWGAASVNGGANNNTLFLFGGIPLNDNETMDLVYTFDTQSNSWSVPKTTSDTIARKYYLTGIIDYNGKMYLFGGYNNGTYVKDMLILDTINLNWGKGSSVNAPTPRNFYGATLLPNQHIIYLGK